MTFLIAILAAVFILTMFAFYAGQFFGYQRGVREVVTLNDLSYRTRLAAETEELKRRGENVAENQKRQLADALEYERARSEIGKPVEKSDAANLLMMPTKPDTPVA